MRTGGQLQTQSFRVSIRSPGLLDDQNLPVRERPLDSGHVTNTCKATAGLERQNSSKGALNTKVAPSAERSPPTALSHATQRSGSSRPPTTTISPPRTPTRASSTRTNALPLSFRAESPFRHQGNTPISPSQSILNLSQKGIASSRLKQWEGSASPEVAPLKLGRSSGSSTTIKPAARGPSLLRNFQGERHPSAADSTTTGRKQSLGLPSGSIMSQLSSRQPSVSTTTRRGVENVDPGLSERLSPSTHTATEREFINKSRRKPAPPITASLSSRRLRSPSQDSSTQTPVVTRVNANPAEPGSSSSVGQPRTLQDEGSVLPVPSRSSDKNSINVPPTEQTERLLRRQPEVTVEHGVGSYRSPSAGNAHQQSPASPITGPSIGTLSVRNPDPRRDNIPQGSLFQSQNEESYFNVNPGLGIPFAAPESRTFPLAKTCPDSSAPPKFGGHSPVIPISPDLSGQSRPTFADKIYSKSPLSKSPGKGLMDKVVGAAKKVQTGFKGRGGNIQRLMHNEPHSPEPLTRPRMNLDRTSTISQVPTAVQRQEERDLQHHWGPERYYIQGGVTNPVAQPAVINGDPFQATPRERELPVGLT